MSTLLFYAGALVCTDVTDSNNIDLEILAVSFSVFYFYYGWSVIKLLHGVQEATGSNSQIKTMRKVRLVYELTPKRLQFCW